MSSIPSQFAKFKESVTPNESIAGLIRKQMKEKSFENKSPKEYFFLTDLCNPTQVYWKFKNPVKVSKSIEKKFALGNKLHDLAGNWFKKINGFLYEEALIDGYYSDLEGVRGKIDFMLNGSIVELKTKEKIPETPDEIISLYPQDLEQVVFYSVLHTEEPDTNYLVFMEDFEPYRIKAYKIITKNKSEVRHIVKQRMSLLKSLLEKDITTGLKKCRYFQNCDYNKNKVCSCSSLDVFKLDKLKESIEITFDEDFTNLLEKNKEIKDIETKRIFFKNNILSSRKYYLDHISDIEYDNDYDNTFVEEWRTYFNNLFKEISLFNMTAEEKEEIKKKETEDRVKFAFRWVKILSSIDRSKKNVPYTLVIRPTDKKEYSNPLDYHIAELGIITANYGTNKGILIEFYPNQGNLLKVYEVKYNDLKERQQVVKSVLNNLEEAEIKKEKYDLSKLPPCEPFMNKKESCPMNKLCKESGNHCID